MFVESERNDFTNTHHVFNLLVLYRWISLIPPFLSLITAKDVTHLAIVLLAAGAVNLFITFFPVQLNAAVRKRPVLLLIDFIFCSALASFTNGWNTPYYLYAFSPLLAAAFFFELPDYEGGTLVWKKSTNAAAAENLTEIEKIVSGMNEKKFSKVDIEAMLLPLAEARGKGDVMWPLRVAMSGQEASPGPFEIMDALGKKESLRRIQLAIEKLASHEDQ